MKLCDILKKEMVWPALKAKTKHEALNELAHLIASGTDLNENMLVEVLLEREMLGSTGIQDGIAIPHGKVAGLKDMVIACARSEGGIDFEAHDGKPTHLFFVLLAPEFAAGQHLKVLARLSKLLKDAHFRERLLAAQDGETMLSAIIEEDGKN